MITRVARLVDNNLMAYQLNAPMLQSLTTRIQGLNDSMACKQFNDVTIQEEILDTIRLEVFALT